MNEILVLESQLLVTFLIIFGIQFVFYVISAALKTEKFYDASGSLTYISAILYGLLNSDNSIRQLLMGIFGLVWTIRLGSHLFIRGFKHPDKRFDELKQNPVRFLIPWVAQILWISLTGFPIYLICANSSSSQKDLQWLDYIGIFLWAFGFSIEALADYQKNKFKNANPGDFIQTGIFQYSRYPNYYGEIVLWYGMFIIGISGFTSVDSWQWVSIISPLFVTALLYFGTGVALSEKNAIIRYGARQDYQEYVARTPKFFLWFPKSTTIRISQ
jgi:steroid 5-alpha reductase family enzyme